MKKKKDEMPQFGVSPGHIRAMRRASKSRGPLSFKDWDTIKPRMIADICRSERLTAEDLAVRINARDCD